MLVQELLRLAHRGIVNVRRWTEGQIVRMVRVSSVEFRKLRNPACMALAPAIGSGLVRQASSAPQPCPEPGTRALLKGTLPPSLLRSVNRPSTE